MRYACGIYCDAAVVHSCVGAQSRVGRGRRANFVAPGAYASALSRMGRKPGLGLVHLAAALLRRAFPTLVLRGVRRNRAGGRSEFASRPSERQPDCACACGSRDFVPEEDVMDTWATSSMTPQIVGRWLSDPELYEKVFPMSLRPQAHEIIRTWAFDTIVKSLYHFGKLPWKTVAISGWGLAGEGMGKISKSRGGGPMAPMQMIEKYSSDAVRYWAASTGFGKDSI